MNYIIQIFCKNTLNFVFKTRLLTVGIVGSGPSGFHVAKHLLAKNKFLTVEILEKDQFPYGLLRYGVAPDHQAIKNASNNFNAVTSSPRFKFIGGFCLGTLMSLSELCEYYDCIVLCYGTFIPKRLSIPGEDLPNVFSSTQIIGWYNKHPYYYNINPISNKNTEIIVLGNGNVALDVSRILAIDPEKLKETDISYSALNSLKNKSQRKVKLVGRRGLQDISFSASEIRLLSKSCISMSFGDEKIQNDDETQSRAVKLMKDFVKPFGNETSLIFYFNRQAVRINSKNNRLCVNFKNRINDSLEEMECDIVVSCIGYTGKSVDQNISFDTEKGKIINQKGRVAYPNSSQSKIYCAGWIKTGSKGLLVDTYESSEETANIIIEDINENSYFYLNRNYK